MPRGRSASEAFASGVQLGFCGRRLPIPGTFERLRPPLVGVASLVRRCSRCTKTVSLSLSLSLSLSRSLLSLHIPPCKQAASKLASWLSVASLVSETATATISRERGRHGAQKSMSSNPAPVISNSLWELKTRGYNTGPHILWS